MKDFSLVFKRALLVWRMAFKLFVGALFAFVELFIYLFPIIAIFWLINLFK